MSSTISEKRKLTAKCLFAWTIQFSMNLVWVSSTSWKSPSSKPAGDPIYANSMSLVFVIDHFHNWRIHVEVEDGVTPNWTCSIRAISNLTAHWKWGTIVSYDETNLALIYCFIFYFDTFLKLRYIWNIFIATSLPITNTM